MWLQYCGTNNSTRTLPVNSKASNSNTGEKSSRKVKVKLESVLGLCV